MSEPTDLPPGAAPAQVEIELTNYCNARCVACPRNDMPRYGFMSRATLEQILDRYEAYVSPLTSMRPKIVVAGGGEPTMHPQVVKMLDLIKQRGFTLTLITNAGRINRVDQAGLLQAVDQLLISFWGISATEYQASMKLDFDRSLANVRVLIRTAAELGTPLAIQWLRTVHTTNDEGAIRAFWRREGVDDVRGGDVSWNRAGEIEIAPERLMKSEAMLPDFGRSIWCADLYLSDSYGWNGDLKLCCCSFFSSRSDALIAAGDFDVMAINRVKQALHAKPDRAECQTCQLPRRIRARQLLGTAAETVPSTVLEKLDYC